ERDSERRIGRNPHPTRHQVAMRGCGFRDVGVGMPDLARPLPFVHEPARLGGARRQVDDRQLAPEPPAQPIFPRVVSLCAYPVEGNAKRILGWSPADGAVPAIIMPGDAYRQVVHRAFPPGFSASWPPIRAGPWRACAASLFVSLHQPGRDLLDLPV